MNTLYIRLPSKAVAGAAPQWSALPCPFALVSGAASIARQGVMSLPDLPEVMAMAQRVVVLLAASDVTLLRIKVPPLSAARLKSALPNLVEDQLIGDPSESVIVADGSSGGLRTIAVVQRDWLDLLARTLSSFGAHRIAAFPAQLCLPHEPPQPGGVTAAVNGHRDAVDVTFRMSEHDGIGLSLGIDPDEPVAREVIQALRAVAADAPVVLYAPQSEMAAYQEAANDATAQGNRIGVLADSWQHWIAGASGTTLDLMGGMRAAAGPKLELRAWRWPLALAVAVLAVNIAALNIDWWRMKRESDSLRASMIQTYKSAFPKETVIIDPAAQMQQKIAAARSSAGLLAPDDFTAITAAFGEAWAGAATAPGKLPAIAALEYRDRSLFVRLKASPETASLRESDAPMQQVKAALAERNLSIEMDPSAPAVWKIRSAK